MPDESINVAIVAHDEVTRLGLAALLGDEPRIRVGDPVEDIDTLHRADAHFDVCVIEYDQSYAEGIEGLAKDDVPVVARTTATDWRPAVAAWIWGARVVVGASVRRGSLVDATLDARYRPHILKPHLARALHEAISVCGLPTPDYLPGLLDDVQRGRRMEQRLTSLNLGDAAFARVLVELREACREAGLGQATVSTPGDDAVHPATLQPGNVPPEAAGFGHRTREVLEYYADGYSYADIGREMSISEHTVRNLVLEAMTKFGIRTHRVADVRILFAIWLSGRHRRPERVLRRLLQLRGEHDEE